MCVKTEGKFFILFDKAVDCLAAISFAILLLIMISVAVSVVLRYFFNYSILWLQEIIEAAILWICFLVAPWVLRRERHVRMDLLTNQLNLRNQALAEAMTSILCAIICLTLVWYGTKVTVYYFQKALYIPEVLNLPYGILTVIIPIGSLLLFVQFIRRTNEYLRKWRNLERL